MNQPPFDPRLTPCRADLAAESLRGRVEAPHFASPRARRITIGVVSLRRAPSASAPQETQALFGEAVDVYDERDGWAWVQLSRDDYVGYLPIETLGPVAAAATHRVVTVRTHLYPDASIKTPPTLALSMGSVLTVDSVDERFSRLAGGGFVIASHVAPVGAVEIDFVAVAERFLYAPYLWGGRTSEGIDCSGLAQGALARVGVQAPRDTDMQEKVLGEPLPPGSRDLRRGDLVFWKGHVGVMSDAVNMLHANGHAMMVTLEPLAEAERRTQQKGGGEVTSIRRLKP
jgi:cell wall-associated NlpC family hydrolase